MLRRSLVLPHGKRGFLPWKVRLYRHRWSLSNQKLRFRVESGAMTIKRTGGTYRDRTGVKGFADLCVTTPPRRLGVGIDAVISFCRLGAKASIYGLIPPCNSPNGRLRSLVWSVGFDKDRVHYTR